LIILKIEESHVGNTRFQVSHKLLQRKHIRVIHRSMTTCSATTNNNLKKSTSLQENKVNTNLNNKVNGKQKKKKKN
jgi:hypothetical protein